MQGLFTGQILADKLAKLNSSQQSIETLSHWCIFHRRSAKQIVDIWEKEFANCPAEQRVPFLYLANDILQNSRRKGGDFVNEFWRVLSRALRDVMKRGNESSRSTVLRLIDIWEERKVFGSHPQGLRVEFLGRDAPPSAKNNDALLPEKLVAVYKAFSDKLGGDDAVIDKCNTAVLQMESLEKDIDVNAVSGQETIILDELQHQEHVLLESIQQLEAVDIARSSIVFQLKETLREQEAKLERTRLLLQAAHSHVEQSRLMQQQIYDVLNGGQAYQPPEEEEAPNGGLDHDDRDSDNDNDHEQEDHDHHQQDVQHYEDRVQIPGMGSHGEEAYVPTEAKGFDPLAAAEVAANLASSGSSAAMFSSVLASLAGDTTVVPAPSAATQEDEDGNIPAAQYRSQEDEDGDIPAAQYRSHEDDDIQARPEKRQKLAGDSDGDEVDGDGESPGLSLSPKTQGNDEVNGSALSSVTMAVTTQFLEASSVLLPPAFSFASQGISFAMPAATATPAPTTAGCAPESYSDVQSNPLSFLLQQTTTSTPQQ